MTLPGRQQHALDAIDDILQSAEPRLATMFGLFNDLNRLEAMPAVETLRPGRWWARHGRPGHHYRPGWIGQPGHHHTRRSQPGRPGRERHPRGGRLGRIALVPLLFIAAASLVIVGLVGSGAAGRRGCGPAAAAAAVMAARLRGTVIDATGGTGSGGTGCPSGRTQRAAGKG